MKLEIYCFRWMRFLLPACSDFSCNSDPPCSLLIPIYSSSTFILFYDSFYPDINKVNNNYYIIYPLHYYSRWISTSRRKNSSTTNHNPTPTSISHRPNCLIKNIISLMSWRSYLHLMSSRSIQILWHAWKELGMTNLPRFRLKLWGIRLKMRTCSVFRRQAAVRLYPLCFPSSII